MMMCFDERFLSYEASEACEKIKKLLVVRYVSVVLAVSLPFKHRRGVQFHL